MDRGIAEGAHDMEAVKDATDLYEGERRVRDQVALLAFEAGTE